MQDTGAVLADRSGAPSLSLWDDYGITSIAEPDSQRVRSQGNEPPSQTFRSRRVFIPVLVVMVVLIVVTLI